VFAGPGSEQVAETLRRYLVAATGFDLPRTDVRASEPSAGAIVLRLEAGRNGLGAEGYQLAVAAEGVRLCAATPAGLFYGLQTFRQLLPPEIYRAAPAAQNRWVASGVEIEDAPRFAWRGAMLDVGRHFMPLSFVERFVDLLAAHKFNVLHLHLTEDHGWRFPSQQYPRLTEVGSWRSATMRGFQGQCGSDGTPHGGYYRLEDLRELVQYAAARFVTIVPEIDFPGHTRAAIAAYPELGNTDEELPVSNHWGIDTHVLNMEAETVDFCRAVLGEVVDVFPGKFIHIGGDECPRDEWENSPAAKARAVELGLQQGVNGLQAWFTGQMNEHLAGRGRGVIGWDEIAEGGLPTGAAVMAWRNEELGFEAAAAGHDVVMAPSSVSYFDYYQSDHPDEPLAIGGLTTLRDVYGYQPVPATLPPDAAAHVLGTQFQIWTEYIQNPDDVEYMAFPRACAFAEVAWTDGPRDWQEFVPRLSGHLRRLDALGVNYRPLEGPRPWQRGGDGVRKRRRAQGSGV
jgi:hexosaminidase